MAQLDKTFPTLDCAACILTPKMVDAAQNDKINLYHLLRGGRGEGLCGQFRRSTIRKKARYVDDDQVHRLRRLHREVSLAQRSNSEFNMGLNNRGAIYIPFAQAIPNVPVIDPDALHSTAQDRQVRPVRKGLLRGRHRLMTQKDEYHRAAVRRHRGGHRLQAHRPGQV